MSRSRKPVTERAYATVDPDSEDADHCEWCGELIEDDDQRCLSREGRRRCKP